ncbi:AAA family ATPase, partial [Candidatus Uhrbacteria bacterium]|nr:AAA family ATPase [Candidatus Uhrbacteria bacterium]
MILERIEIQGFKSFAQRTVLDFPARGMAVQGSTTDLSGHDNATRKSIAVIVGPNGSGKSNISDAIKWVLGEQSLKSIRGKKSEDIIFSGSDKKARLGFAEVSLFLKNEKAAPSADRAGSELKSEPKNEIDPEDFSELVITRRLYRDGESHYLINRQEARLLDINMLLAKMGFGQKSYQIIGQGTIDSVLMATPLERKEFFDDAVGVKPFQIKRDQALRQLERTEENLWQGEMLLKELEPRMRSLSRQVKKLEQRELIQSELKLLQKKYYGHLYFQLQNQLK